MKRLDRKFFDRSTVLVAQELLGKFLVRKMGPSTSSGQAKIIRARIIETEAYCGKRDLACHASKGLTERTKVMFGSAGFSYVYMVYGMYHCLNIVTEKEGNPSAVLIRAAVVDNRLAKSVIHKCRATPRLTSSILNGPGKLCRELKIDRKLNGVDITKSNLLWIEDGENKIKKSQINPFGKLRVNGEQSRTIKKGKRIGVDYAGKWKDKLWRFYAS